MKFHRLVNIYCKRKFFEKIIRNALSLLERNDVNKVEYSITNYVLLHYYVKAIKLSKGIYVLSREKLNSDMQILLRCLFEVFCYCEYINIDLKDEKRAENCIALSWIESNRTENLIERYGAVDINNMRITSNEKDSFRASVVATSKTIRINYEFILNKLKQRSPIYKDLKDKDILREEKFSLQKAIEDINVVFNKETNNKDFIWKHYTVMYRDWCKSVHANDFDNNVRMDGSKLRYILREKTQIIDTYYSISYNFLIRIMDIANDVFVFKFDGEIKKMFDEATKLSLTD